VNPEILCYIFSVPPSEKGTFFHQFGAREKNQLTVRKASGGRMGVGTGERPAAAAAASISELVCSSAQFTSHHTKKAKTRAAPRPRASLQK